MQDNKGNYNTTNLHEYDPYLWNEDKKTLFVDCDWWKNTLTDFAKKTVEKRIVKLSSSIVINHDEKVIVPHQRVDSAAELCMYKTYLDAHDFNVWYQSLEITVPGTANVYMIELTPEDKRSLAEIARKHMKEAKPIDVEDENNLQFLKVAKIILEDEDDDESLVWFMRLSGTSGKNEVPLEPVKYAAEVLKNLVSNVLFLHQEYEREEKDTWLILKPWNDKIEKKNEFRVFFCNGKITGVSQQHWQQLFCYSDDELDVVENAILSANFLQSGTAPYTSFVADVWVSFETSICYLIEYNPFGAHCGAGSSLFEWERDYNILYGVDGAAEFRFSSLLL